MLGELPTLALPDNPFSRNLVKRDSVTMIVLKMLAERRDANQVLVFDTVAMADWAIKLDPVPISTADDSWVLVERDVSVESILFLEALVNSLGCTLSCDWWRDSAILQIIKFRGSKATFDEAFDFMRAEDHFVCANAANLFVPSFYVTIQFSTQDSKTYASLM